MGNGDVAPSGLVFLFAMFGSFFWLLLIACDTRRRRNLGTKKARRFRRASGFDALRDLWYSNFC